MKKFLALSCALAVFFSFTAFDWGNSSEPVAQSKKTVAAPSPAPAASSDPITALNNLLGSGTPEERQAKLDNLVRLSQMMPLISAATNSQAATPAPAAPAYQETKAPAKKSSRW